MNDNKQFERVSRAFHFETTEAEDYNISGLAVVYNQAVDIGGMFEEVIERGALNDRALQDVILLANHDMNVPAMARSRRNNANSTLKLDITDNGLEIKANIDTAAHYMASAVFSGVKRGDLDAMSFLFTVKRQEWDRLDSDYPLRRILEIDRIFEVSAVNFAAYSKTQLSTRGDALVKADLTALESAKRDYIDNADDEKLQLEKAKMKIMYGGMNA